MMSRARRTDLPAPDQGWLFADAYIGGWPPLERFPTNSSTPRVAGIVAADLAGSHAPLVITGYASLDRLIGWLAECQSRRMAGAKEFRSIRLLLGNEPFPTDRTEFRLPGHAASQELIDYWLERGISLHRSGQLLAALDLLRDGPVEVRAAATRPIHAKIYMGDEAITIGSSNFTRSGLEQQIEANVRLTLADGRRWEEARGMAEEIWALGVDCRQALIALLERLLSSVTWQEALARACAELLEGSWAERFRDASGFDEGERLWPSQEQGVAHALWVLEHQGSVLVADATGSGKTLMGAHLIRRVMRRLDRTGRGRSEPAVLMAPPAVLREWERNAGDCGASMKGYSQGHLSHGGSDVGAQLRRAIRRTQVLAIDEAHNFLRRSKRTVALFSNIADHVLLFTATPVNRGPRDLLAMIDLLGADNLDEDTLVVLNRLWKRRGELRDTLSAEERDQLRRAIRRFTVRRTKADLNRMVDRDPERYRAASGRVCRYPEHRPLTYDCGEPERDLEIAAKIRETANRLRGLTRLVAPLELSEALRRDGLSEEAYLTGRIRGAAALAAHEIAASLRSSKVRLLEHLRGTDAVLRERPDLQGARVPSKSGVMEILSEIAGRTPKSRLRAELPEWLRDPDTHSRACELERLAYEEIEALTRELSETREDAKADLLVSLANKHRLVLAFDSHLITLADLRERLERRGKPGREIIVATGGASSGRNRLYQTFRPDSEARDVIALCSDALAEGVNLQGASVVVMLDMPSVIRVAEQRIGRVDRMNSPHDIIEAHWPVDPPPFAVRASERLAERHRFVAENLGANLQLPPELAGDGGDAIVRYDDFVAGLKAAAEGSGPDELEDVLAPVRALVDGPGAIVAAAVYAHLRESHARVVSSVSVVRSPVSFAFVAISGTEWGAPRWAYLANPTAAVVTDLDAISTALRGHLTPETAERSFDSAAAEAVDRVLTTLAAQEELLLPRGKQRALAEMRHVLRRYLVQSRADERRSRTIERLLELASGREADRSVDRAALADWWLRVIQPVRFRHLKARTRVRPVLLRDLRRDLLNEPIETAQLEAAFEVPLFARPLDERVVAAIVGVPDATNAIAK